MFSIYVGNENRLTINIVEYAGLCFRDVAHSRHFVPSKLHAFSPQVNYTDQATATCRRSLCQFLRIEGVAWSAQRIPTALNLDFLDPDFVSSRMLT
jgi:hypothetical protein